MIPSPLDSAATYPVGYLATRNDGNLWEIKQTSNGVKIWVRCSTDNTIKPLFKSGDKVVIVESGFGCHSCLVGTQVVIDKCIQKDNLFVYTIVNQSSYRHTIGEFDYSSTFDTINERSFSSLDYSNLNIEKLIKQQKNKKMATSLGKGKSLTKNSAKEVRVIDTSLINKEEVFKMLALAESTGLPCLLVGNPGVAKTKTIIEYAKAWLNKDGNMTAEDFANKIYILETDEGTKASEIKGIPDLGKLFTNNQYTLNTPIADAEIVIINEVDKASSAIRNAMLGVMNEKFLFNGKHKIPCKWKLFVATCNEIPKEEIGSPFWDRFMLKMTVNRVSAGELVKYFDKGARNYRERISISVPTKDEMANIVVPTKKLEKYLEVGYQHSSDRTLTFVPGLAKAISFIWNQSIDKALVKTAQIMISQSAGSELQNKLMSPEVKAIMSKVEMLNSYTTNEQLELAIAEIEAGINAYTTRGIMDETQVTEIETTIDLILSTHPARKDYQSSEDFDNMMGELAGDVADALPRPTAENPF
jgi:MoxR-like ATPase